jgi:hypothetical protein
MKWVYDRLPPPGESVFIRSFGHDAFAWWNKDLLRWERGTVDDAGAKWEAVEVDGPVVAWLEDNAARPLVTYDNTPDWVAMAQRKRRVVKPRPFVDASTLTPGELFPRDAWLLEFAGQQTNLTYEAWLASKMERRNKYQGKEVVH